MTKLADGQLLPLLPASIGDDPQMRAAAEALAPALKALSLSIPNLLIYARLGAAAPDRRGRAACGALSDEGRASMNPPEERPKETLLPPLARLAQARGGLKPLSLEEVEQLAWQFHVDFRETATTLEQLAAMVRNAIPWHRIKGTPAGIKRALGLFGYSGISIEEDGTGEYWAAYQLGLSGVTSAADLARIVAVCREMQPARCRLWRVYTPEYDFRPGVWSGPLPVCAWSACWWSNYSGTAAPDIPGLDDEHNLIVSFGSNHAALAQRLCPRAACVGRTLTLTHGWQARYRDYPAWSECAYGDMFPRNHSFTFSHIFSFTWAMPVYERSTWTGPWDKRTWRGTLLRVDRELEPWRFQVHGAALSEGVWSGLEPGYERPAFSPDPAHGRVLDDAPGAWSSLNACWSAPTAYTLPAPQIWSENAWSADALKPQRRDSLEIAACLRGVAVQALRPNPHGFFQLSTIPTEDA